ncbi:MAG: family 16 glycosylhydrolase [Marinosulfonomonas sp.]
MCKIQNISSNLKKIWAQAALTCLLASPLYAADLVQGTSFVDDFSSLNRARWYVSEGWSNGDWQNCEWSKKAVEVKNGKLLIKFSPTPAETRQFTCGEIQSKQVFGYGTYEARLKTPVGSGLNAAFFTYIGPTHNKPHDEIDFEILTKDTSAVSLNTYVSGKPNNGTRVALPAPSDSTYLDYAFVWSAEKIEWYVNGVKIHETAPDSPRPVTDQKIFASFWGSEKFTEWMGPFVAPDHDLVMSIDWIAFTAEAEDCQFPTSVHCTLE